MLVGAGREGFITNPARGTTRRRRPFYPPIKLLVLDHEVYEIYEVYETTTPDPNALARGSDSSDSSSSDSFPFRSEVGVGDSDQNRLFYSSSLVTDDGRLGRHGCRHCARRKTTAEVLGVRRLEVL